ncbi:DivIVA domain-containing protein [Brevibacterium spongiae]|uniref:DivIVA domain-containing protein n=1 Tax=Brevibacterium spongiae TaxID=2909672 RepID=A0ABY5SSR2_9MICO|nr:DivIVA domain-containing protein [Brevibacterium spongiae]UVI37587.1 DivIVA domain-containing protein [Brevibacterium spongiae]
MPLWIVIGVAAAVFVLVIVVAASFNVFSAETGDEAQERWTGLPEGFTSADLDAVSFRPALRGYRMEDVDEAMQILQERLRALESAAVSPAAVSPGAVTSAASSADVTPTTTPAATPADDSATTSAGAPVPADASDEASETAARPR